MSKNKIIALKKPGYFSKAPLTVFLRSGAKRLIADVSSVSMYERHHLPDKLV